MDYLITGLPDSYRHYKYYHFFSLCFGLGCGMALYKPFRPLVVPISLGVIFTIVFEIAGCMLDFYWLFSSALFVAILNLHLYNVYILSSGCGIIVFALRGATRKCNSLWKKRGWR